MNLVHMYILKQQTHIKEEKMHTKLAGGHNSWDHLKRKYVYVQMCLGPCQ